MSSLTKDQVLAKRFDLPREPVDVPALGGTVYVRVISLAVLAKVVEKNKALSADPGREHESLAVLVIAGACDEAGVPLFTDDDHDALLGLPVDALRAVAAPFMRLNGMNTEAFEDGRKN